MKKKLVIALGLAVLLIGSSSIAMADVITFNFGFSSTKVDVASTGLTVTNASNLTLSDADTSVLVNPFKGSVDLSTGAATAYSNFSSIISASYLTGGLVEVDSAANCPGGTMPGVCLQGFLNGNGTYATTAGKSASFQGLFVVTYVSPDVFTALGLPANTTWDPKSGSDSITTGNNTRVNATDATATLGGGTITFQTTVPEPGTLALLGTGILGLARLIRRKRQ